MNPDDILLKDPEIKAGDVRCLVVPVGKEGQVRVNFVIPNEAYEIYQADTDAQYEISSRFFDLLEELVGAEKVERHVFDIKVLPADTNQFWRDPKPTATNVAGPPPSSQPKDLEPLDKLAGQFQAMIKG